MRTESGLAAAALTAFALLVRAAWFGELREGPWGWGVRPRGASWRCVLDKAGGRPHVAVSVDRSPRPTMEGRRVGCHQAASQDWSRLSAPGLTVCLAEADGCAWPPYLTTEGAGQKV